jgi:hypothetical protein
MTNEAKTKEEKERLARWFIAQEIHKRDGIVLGRDPLGRECGCDYCLAVSDGRFTEDQP